MSFDERTETEEVGLGFLRWLLSCLGLWLLVLLTVGGLLLFLATVGLVLFLVFFLVL